MTTTRVLTVGAASIIGLEALASTIAPDVLWGMHHLAFLPPAVAVCLCLGALALLGARQPVIEVCCQLLARWPLRRLPTHLVLAGAAAALFALPVTHSLLGDGSLLAASLRSSSPFDLGHNVYRALALLHRSLSTPGWDPHSTFRLVGALSGAVYVGSAVAIAERLGQDRVSRAGAFLLMILQGAILLFFGYQELYAPVFALCMASLACLVLWNGSDPRWLALAAALSAVAIAGHPLAAYLAAPMAWGLVHHGRSDGLGAIRSPAVFVAAIATIACWGLTLQHFRASTGNILPWSGPYSLASTEHATDLLNVYLLVTPLHGVVLAAALRPKEWRQIQSLGPALGIATGTAMALAAVLHPELGSLDWDVLSIYCVPLAVLTALAACHRGSALTGPLIPVILAVSLVHLVPWVAVNLTEARAVQMVQAMTHRDAHQTSERRMKLALRMAGQGHPDAALVQLRRALEDDPADYTALHSVARLYYHTWPDSLERALAQYGRSLEAATPEDDTRLTQSILNWHRGAPSQAAVHWVDFILDHPQSQDARLFGERMVQSRLPDTTKGIVVAAWYYVDGDPEASREVLRLLRGAIPHDPTVVRLRALVGD